MNVSGGRQPLLVVNNHGMETSKIRGIDELQRRENVVKSNLEDCFALDLSDRVVDISNLVDDDERDPDNYKKKTQEILLRCRTSAANQEIDREESLYPPSDVVDDAPELPDVDRLLPKRRQDRQSSFEPFRGGPASDRRRTGGSQDARNLPRQGSYEKRRGAGLARTNSGNSRSSRGFATPEAYPRRGLDRRQRDDSSMGRQGSYDRRSSRERGGGRQNSSDHGYISRQLSSGSGDARRAVPRTDSNNSLRSNGTRPKPTPQESLRHLMRGDQQDSYRRLAEGSSTSLHPDEVAYLGNSNSSIGNSLSKMESHRGAQGGFPSRRHVVQQSSFQPRGHSQHEPFRNGGPYSFESPNGRSDARSHGIMQAEASLGRRASVAGRDAYRRPEPSFRRDDHGSYYDGPYDRSGPPSREGRGGYGNGHDRPDRRSRGGYDDEPSFSHRGQAPPMDHRYGGPPPPSRHQDDLEIEIEPGVFARLRGAEETWVAVEDGQVAYTDCMCCGANLMCIDDALYVLCPECKVVSPLFSDGGRGNPHGGVGLGLRADDLGNQRRPMPSRYPSNDFERPDPRQQYRGYEEHSQDPRYGQDHRRRHY